MTNKLVPSIEQVIEKFFAENLQQITLNYPGILLSKIKEIGKFSLSALYLGRNKILLDIYLDQLIDGVPLQYLASEAYFFTDFFYVDENVLIPRSETEILVELALEYVNKRDLTTILDIGTGSGAIALSLANNTKHKVAITACDISKEALKVARFNAFLHEHIRPCESTITFVESDLGNDIQDSFDLVVSNPPYIMRNKDFVQVQNNVAKFEPDEALFIEDENYISWFERFFTDSYRLLNKNGSLIMEGHENHLKDLIQIAIDCGFKNVKIKQDYNNFDRFLIAEK